MIPRRRRHLVAGAIVAAVGLLLTAAYWLFDPSRFIFPRCPVYVITGWQCPGCGSQRALHALLHGDVASAWHYNAFLLCMAPVVALLLFSEFFRDRYPRLNRALTGQTAVICLIVVILLWTIGRNIFL